MKTFISILLLTWGSVTYAMAQNSQRIDGFKLSIQPASISINPGDTTQVQVEAVRSHHFSSEVELSVNQSNLPAEIELTWSSTSLAPGERSVLQIITKEELKPGTYSLLVFGKSRFKQKGSVLILKLASPQLSSHQ